MTTQNTMDATEFVNSLTRDERIGLVTECLNAATDKARRTHDRIDWLVVQDWEVRLGEEIEGGA
jgi:hypothetical protein